jgi:hypothetical protein
MGVIAVPRCRQFRNGTAKELPGAGDTRGDPTAGEILRLLRGAERGLARTDIAENFKRHQSSTEIGRAFAVLQSLGLVRSERHETSGRTAEVWFPGVRPDTAWAWASCPTRLARTCALPCGRAFDPAPTNGSLPICGQACHCASVRATRGQRQPLYPRLDLCGHFALCRRYGVIVTGLLLPSESNT